MSASLMRVFGWHIFSYTLNSGKTEALQVNSLLEICLVLGENGKWQNYTKMVKDYLKQQCSFACACT